MVKRQRAFEAADDQLYGKKDEETEPEDGGEDTLNANKQPPKCAPATGGAKK